MEKFEKWGDPEGIIQKSLRVFLLGREVRRKELGEEGGASMVANGGC